MGAAMSVTSVQFTVAAHLMTALAFWSGEGIASAMLAESVNTDPSFVRKSLSKLGKAGLVRTKRGKNGASTLARPPKRITLLDIYRASEAPQAFAIHAYPANKRCAVSCNIKDGLQSVLLRGQKSFEKTLAGITLADLVAEVRKRSD
jgi:Rrf2 family protein